MTNCSRLVDCQRKIFKDKDGRPINGMRMITAPNASEATTVDTILVYYLNGLIHNEEGPAVLFKDGHQENWTHGIFKSVAKKAFNLR